MEKQYNFTELDGYTQGAFIAELEGTNSYENLFQYEAYYLPDKFKTEGDGNLAPVIIRVSCSTKKLDSGWKRVVKTDNAAVAAKKLANSLLQGRKNLFDAL